MQRRRKNEWWPGYYLPLREKSRHGYTSRSPFRVNDSYCATVQHSERADRHTVESPIQPFPGEDHIQKYPTIRLNIAGKQKGNIQVVSGVVSTSEYLFGLGWQVRSGNGLLKVVGWTPSACHQYQMGGGGSGERFKKRWREDMSWEGEGIDPMLYKNISFFVWHWLDKPVIQRRLSATWWACVIVVAETVCDGLSD